MIVALLHEGISLMKAQKTKRRWYMRKFMIGKKPVLLEVLAGLLAVLTGCASSSRLVDIWSDPGFSEAPLERVLVIAVRKDATKRRIWEDAFTGELVKHGVAATSSYHLFPDLPPDTNQVVATVLANGFDGILAILMLPTETTTQRVAGYTTTERDERHIPDNHPYRRRNQTYNHPYWIRYRTYYYREIEHPEYVDSQTVDVRAIDVSTAGNSNRLIWSATSRTPDPASVTDVQRGISGLVLADLVRKNIIRGRQ
jgi:hypothetical protein